MKKTILILLAVAAAACTKVETLMPDRSELNGEIDFQVVQRIQTKANTPYSTSVPFGTYAWYTADSTNTTSSQNVPFMVNETIAFTGSVWKAQYNTYYWPKTGSIDFISYSPFRGANGVAVDTTNYKGSNPVVKADTLRYFGVNTAAGNVDYMYADKVTVSKNEDKVQDGVHSYTGVPTVFRHALSKLSFKMKASFVHYVDTTITRIEREDTTVIDTVLVVDPTVIMPAVPDSIITTIVKYHYPDTTYRTIKEYPTHQVVDSLFCTDTTKKRPANIADTTITTITRYPKDTVKTITAVHYPEITSHPTTYWDITVKSAKIFGFYTTGDCELTLNTQSTGMMVPWDKPEVIVGNKKYNVWSNLKGDSAKQELIGGSDIRFYYDIDNDEEVNQLTNLNDATGFVMPQMLKPGKQMLQLVVHIKTTLSNGHVIEEDYCPVISMSAFSSLKAWEMNQHIVYTITLKPVAYDSSYETPEDVTITFDPAVADWSDVDANATIQL